MLHFKSFKLAILATTAVVAVALTGCAPTQEVPLSANASAASTEAAPTQAASTAFAPRTESIMKIHEGMTSDKILEMFGTPKSVSQAVCGGAVSKPWTCTTWEYGEAAYRTSWASFTFSGDRGSLILNNFDIHRN
jgi:hypothetical protein